MAIKVADWLDSYLYGGNCYKCGKYIKFNCLSPKQYKGLSFSFCWDFNCYGNHSHKNIPNGIFMVCLNNKCNETIKICSKTNYAHTKAFFGYIPGHTCGLCVGVHLL